MVSYMVSDLAGNLDSSQKQKLSEIWDLIFQILNNTAVSDGYYTRYARVSLRSMAH